MRSKKSQPVIKVRCKSTATPQDVEEGVSSKLSQKRWLILCIFVCYTTTSSVQWAEFSIVSNVVSRYYNVDIVSVEWTTMLYMLAYVTLIVPALFLIDSLGVRGCMLLAGTGIWIGSVIKTFSVSPNRYAVLFVGQSLVAASQVLTFGLAATVTAAWFGANEIALSGALALFGDQFGAALGFILPPLFVKNDEDITVITDGLLRLNILVAGICTLVLILIFFFFESKPKMPPSNAQKVQLQLQSESIVDSSKKIFSNKSFIMMLASYGLNIGTFNVIATTLNRTILQNFQDGEKHIGRMGFAGMISGILGSIVVGWYLDKKHLFKETTIFVTVSSFLTAVGYVVALKSSSMLFVYITVSVLGFFQMGYYATGVQMGIEVTYPVREAITAGYMLLSVQLSGLILTSIYDQIFEHSGDLSANIFVCALLLASAIFALLIPADLQRQKVEMTSSINENHSEQAQVMIKLNDVLLPQ